MPGLTRNGVSFSDAQLEAASIAPDGRAMFDMLEFFPPDGRAPFRIVNNHEAITATIEATADVDPGVAVVWRACPCRIKPADESDSASSPETVLEVDNISGLITTILGETRGIRAPWVVINRKYASDVLSAPAQLPPTVVEIANVSLEGDVAQFSCAFGDAGNFGFPGLTFQRDQYPVLER